MNKLILLYILISSLIFGGNKEIFFKAIESKDYKSVESFINKGFDLELKNDNDETALSIAVNGNDIKLAKLLIENGASVNIDKEDEWSYSYLSMALINNFRDMAKLLIEYGSNVNEEFEFQYFGFQEQETPLIWASDRDDLELCKMLVESGATINKEYGGYTALGKAAINSVKCTKYLIEQGADILKGAPILNTLWNDSLETAKLLFDAGVPMRASYKSMYDLSYESLLNLALYENAKKISKFLIEKDIRLNESNSSGEIPLTIAAEKLNLNAINLLLQNGVEINSKNNLGYTAIMKAVEQDSTIITEFLIDKGADTKLINNDGKRLLQLASTAKMRKFLISKGVK